MMQMLSAGGMPILTDKFRQPDEDNPKGYFEWEPVKRLRDHPDQIAGAEGRAVKIVSPLIESLPNTYHYQVLFMERPIAETLRSQAEMVRRRSGEEPASASDPPLQAAYEKHLRQVLTWMEERENFRLLHVSFGELVREPLIECLQIRDFLGRDLDVVAMASQVDPLLYRQRLTRVHG
jgi:hypothetical protein